MSPAAEAACASASVSNGAAEVPVPPGAASLATYQTRPVIGRLSVPVEVAVAEALHGDESQTR